MGSTENVVRVDELSSLMNRLSGHLQLPLQDSDVNSQPGALQSNVLPLTLKTPAQTAASQWTIHLIDQSQALKSIRLQLDAQGQWRVALDMQMHTESRLSGAIAQDLQTRLEKNGHRINKLTIYESADEPDAYNE